MKNLANSVLFLFFAFSIMSFGTTNTSEDIITNLADGKWDVVLRTKEKKVVASTLERVEASGRKARDGNHNKEIYHFDKEGNFSIMSIESYSDKDKKGTFTISSDEKTLKTIAQYSNKPDLEEYKAIRKKVFKINYEILHLEGDYMVLKHGGNLTYFHRIH